MAIRVINPGLATTVQDLGRPGHFHLGIPMSGAMDQMALRTANLLVGNKEDAAALEAVFMAPEFVAESNFQMAVTGAAMPVYVDDVEQQSWTTISVATGQTVRFDYPRAGARVYIAFSGGIDVPEVLGSRSTYLVGAFGGFQRRPLAAGDVVPLGGGDNQPQRSLPDALRPDSPRHTELRVLPGLYWHRITEAAGERFFSDQWTVAPEADRMGYRFRGGAPVEFVDREPPFGAGADPSNIVDSSYAYGSIQIPGGSEPIVLHRDAVSAGGYFQIGAVISADMDKIGQMLPNATTRFVRVDMDTALQARKDRATQMQSIRDAL